MRGRGQKAKEDEIRWVLEDGARRPSSYYGLFYKYINIQWHTVIV